MDLEMQLRAAESRRAELERQHGEALAALRGCGPETLEARQSRVRELEKKVALETVRCEELQLELASAQRCRMNNMSYSGGCTTSPSMPLNQPALSSATNWPNKGTEIERIMAKIEQDNRILAELDHSRSTTLAGGGSCLATSASSHALGECSPPISPITMSHTTPSIYPTNYHHQQHHIGSNYPPISSSSGYSSSMPSSSTNYSTQYNNPLTQHNYNSKLMAGSTLVGQSLVGNMPLTGGASGAMSSLVSSAGLPSSSLTYTNNCSTYSGTLAGQTAATTAFNNPTFSNSMAATANNPLNQFNLPSSYNTSNNVTFSNPLSSQFNSLALGGTTSSGAGMSIKLKPLDDVDLGGRRVATPVTPHQPSWGLTSTALTSLSHQGPRILLTDGIDSDWSGLHTTSGATTGTYLNGHNPVIDGQVDMLDIPGKGRCSVYIARFSYEPEPDSEEELNIQAGDYLLVWGDPVGPGGYLDAELLDGRRGLVPSHFVQRLIGDDLLEFHQAVLSTLREEEINQENFAADVQRLNEMAEMSEAHEDDGPEVPAPRQLTLERQLNKSVLISWTAPDNLGPGNHIESYHVYVDGVLKTTIKATERTRALVEGVESNRPHRISVRSVTANRRTSRDAACTMIIGRDTHQLGPSAVRASNITSTSAVISWLPANSNHQHVVCVNNVEVRTVKPGVYRHTITGLTANTQYRVTVRAKHHRVAQNIANIADIDLPMPAAAHTDFRTLPKGLPDPPSDIMVEPGPQDGTLLVTWHPILTQHHAAGGSITGYAVYADGKKVTDVDSPTGDHALIDISKLLGLNPKHVTVRTKARDSQSADSLPTAIPLSVLRGGGGRMMGRQHQPHSAVMPAHLRQQGQMQQNKMQGQQIIEPDENLSDKEIFPSSNSQHRQQQQSAGIPSIASSQHQRSIAEITKDAYEGNLSEDEMLDRRNQRQYQQQQQGQQQRQYNRQNPQQQQQNQQQAGQQQVTSQRNEQREQQQQYYQQQQQPQQQVFPGQQQRQMHQMRSQQQMPGAGRSGNLTQQQQSGGAMGGGMNQPPNPQKRARWFVALFDYDPSTMSPNPDACDEELPFSEGDTIKVWGDKDADGFYWGECRNRRGYVPHNMVMEVEGNQNRDRWGDIYQNMPVKRMVALYDYDPQELSPNVDAEQVELSFTTGQIINVYGEMDDDGFYMGEIDGVRGLVPSNFLTEAPDQYGPGAGAAGQTSQQQGNSAGMMGRGQRGGRGIGPGARGPPPPPRDNQMRPRNKDACPVLPSQLDNAIINTATPNTQVFTEHNQQGRGRGMLRQGGNQQQQQQQQQQQPGILAQAFNSAFSSSSNNPQQQQQSTTSTLGSLFGGGNSNTQQQQHQQQQHQQHQQQQQQQHAFSGGGVMSGQNRMQQKGIPQVIPNVMGGGMGQQQQQMGQQQQQQPGMPGQQGPNLMQKLNEITAPGGDILSKGKELIFMKFGLGGGK